MPVPKNKYPDNWREFSLLIRYGRAKGKCEICGAENGKPHPKTGSKTFLACAHLDNTGGVCTCYKTTGRKCAIPEHVVAACQVCHYNIDKEYRVFKRAYREPPRNSMRYKVFISTILIGAGNLLHFVL